MGWIGKFLGGTVGYVLGGPIGAIAGAVFGHALVDAGDELELSQSHNRLTTVEHANAAFFVATFSMLAKLVKADGRITNAEIETINAFMANELRLTPQSRQVAMNIFQTAMNAPEPFDAFATQFYEQFRSHPQLLEFMLDILLRVASADNDFSQAEENLVLSAVRIFRFSPEAYERLKRKYIKDTERFYAILGCRRSDDDETIKHNYRKLVRDYHPDTIAAKGLPEEFNKFAHEKFREIQEAYEAVKQERGI